ncbi:MAG: TetR/AcrR family transcriptional regulator [Caulobacter sp.]|nr:TetR/AcrR family transcriptional regulator [Caulobacter sp.]
MTAAPPDRRTTKKEQREASVARILDAALNGFLGRGYRSTTVEDIAAAAGLTKGAIYFYFENKTAVFLALLDRIETLIIGGMKARVAAAGVSPLNQLVAVIHNQGALAENHSRELIVFTIAMAEFAGVDDPIERRLQQIYGQLCETIEGIIVRGQACGDFHSHVSPGEFASIIMALEHGTLLEWYFRGRSLNGPELVRAARTILLEGVVRRPRRGD